MAEALKHKYLYYNSYSAVRSAVLKVQKEVRTQRKWDL